jgi:hypothetical protein
MTETYYSVPHWNHIIPILIAAVTGMYLVKIFRGTKAR